MEIENKKIDSQEKEIIEEVSKDYDKIIIESNKRISDYSSLNSFDKLEIKTPNAGGDYLRSNLEKFVDENCLEGVCTRTQMGNGTQIFHAVTLLL